MEAKLEEARCALALKRAGAKDAFVAKEWILARRLYTECLELRPSDAALYSNRAACFLELKQYEAALADGDAALERDATFAKSEFRRGKALEGLHRLAEAVAAYERGLALEPTSKGFAAAALRARALLGWLRAREPLPSCECPELDCATEATPAQRALGALENELVSKGASSYYYADADRAARAFPKPASALDAERRANLAPERGGGGGGAPGGGAMLLVDSYSWSDADEHHLRVYLALPPEEIAQMDVERDVEVRVDARDWSQTRLDVYAHTPQGTKHLRIPRVYDKIRYASVVKKKKHLLITLLKLTPARWPQLEWDHNRDNEHCSRVPQPGLYST